MNNWPRDRAVCILLLAILFSTSNILFAGSEPPATNDKDYSKEVVPLEQSWCETPKPFEIRIGMPGWLSGVSGDVGVKGVVGSVDVPFHAILDHLTHVPISLAMDIRDQRWEIFVNGEYIELGDSVTLPGLLFTNA